jgi:hypothetical protein
LSPRSELRQALSPLLCLQLMDAFCAEGFCIVCRKAGRARPTTSERGSVAIKAGSQTRDE